MGEAIVVSDELNKHYQEIVGFKNTLMSKDSLTKNNDIIAALNAITKILVELTKLLEKTHNAENFAAVKQILIATLKDVDTETCDEYIKALKEKNLI